MLWRQAPAARALHAASHLAGLVHVCTPTPPRTRVTHSATCMCIAHARHAGARAPRAGPTRRRLRPFTGAFAGSSAAARSSLPRSTRHRGASSNHSQPAHHFPPAPTLFAVRFAAASSSSIHCTRISDTSRPRARSSDQPLSSLHNPGAALFHTAVRGPARAGEWRASPWACRHSRRPWGAPAGSARALPKVGWQGGGLLWWPRREMAHALGMPRVRACACVGNGECHLGQVSAGVCSLDLRHARGAEPFSFGLMGMAGSDDVSPLQGAGFLLQRYADSCFRTTSSDTEFGETGAR